MSENRYVHHWQLCTSNTCTYHGPFVVVNLGIKGAITYLGGDKISRWVMLHCECFITFMVKMGSA